MIMSTQATAETISTYVDARPDPASERGFFQRAMDAFVRSRMMSARAVVARELNTLSDDHLKALGLSDDEVTGLRKTGRLIV